MNTILKLDLEVQLFLKKQGLMIDTMEERLYFLPYFFITKNEPHEWFLINPANLKPEMISQLALASKQSSYLQEMVSLFEGFNNQIRYLLDRFFKLQQEINEWDRITTYTSDEYKALNKIAATFKHIQSGGLEHITGQINEINKIVKRAWPIIEDYDIWIREVYKIIAKVGYNWDAHEIKKRVDKHEIEMANCWRIKMSTDLAAKVFLQLETGAYHV